MGMRRTVSAASSSACPRNCANRPSSRSTAHRRESTQAGLGLGLAVVKAVQALDGTIGVERSTLGRASFFIELPEAEKTHSTLEPKRCIVIIGGVAAGTKVASKIARLDHQLDHQTEVTLVERGDALSYAGCGLPYYIAGRDPASAPARIAARSRHRRLLPPFHPRLRGFPDPARRRVRAREGAGRRHGYVAL
jgi:hypothetical protein